MHKLYVARENRYLLSKTSVQTETPTVLFGIRRGADGAVMSPGAPSHSQAWLYIFRLIRRVWALTWTSIILESCVCSSGSYAFPQMQHFLSSGATSCASSTMGKSGRGVRPWPRLPFCWPRGREEGPLSPGGVSRFAVVFSLFLPYRRCLRSLIFA